MTSTRRETARQARRAAASLAASAASALEQATLPAAILRLCQMPGGCRVQEICRDLNKLRHLKCPLQHSAYHTRSCVSGWGDCHQCVEGTRDIQIINAARTVTTAVTAGLVKPNPQQAYRQADLFCSSMSL